VNLQDILSLKGTAVYTTPPEATLAEVVDRMVHHNVGALLVCRRDPASGEQLVGIVTERDLLRLFAAGRGEAAEVARLAHRLKGSVAYLGAATATETCARLDELGHGGPSAELDALVRELGLRIERLQAALAPHRKPPA
jgi:CBS domain-containing protein